MLRPSLQIEHENYPKSVETVSVYYKAGHYDPILSPGSTATVNFYGSRPDVHGHAKYVRVWVYNFCGFPAYKCQVFMDRILLNGRVLEAERSPLHWMDFDPNVFEYPNAMRCGHKNGWYVDVCAADSTDPRLQVISLGGSKGRHRFGEPGIYTLELCAEAAKPCSFGHLTIHVSHDEKNWNKLKVVSIEAGKKWSRIW